ncbi:MAG TPA: transcription antitermination factor NusB [Opitutaceae bacterium]|nr:transcription antitermination factor NusB [Opitutaceae bacterium]
MSAATEGNAAAAWPSAVRLVARWLDRHERIDALLETLPPGLAGAERARCQNLVLGVVRHFGRLDAALARLVAHPPRFLTRAVLFVAGYELIESAAAPASEGRAAKIGHHAVEQTKTIASPAEARLVNAVARKLAVALAGPPPAANATAEELAEYFSHPDWLVKSWLAQFGAEATRALLEWNQQPATVYARWRTPEEQAPEFLRPTRWPGFFEVASGHWAEVEPLLKGGKLYLQDPSTRLPVELLAPKTGEAVLDLCAAPGGKSLLIADAIKTGRLVAADLPAEDGKPDKRIERLKENLSRAAGLDVALVLGDVLGAFAPILREHKLPADYAAVLIDVPCSNTGVMRHRVDVKWRLQAGDFKKHPRQQLSMLHAAARFVAPGGRLVYSTCSIDAEENEHVVREFLASRAGGPFELAASMLSFPWTTGHDGGAAFLLRKK